MRLSVTLSLGLLILTGCANREGVSPSQNSSLHAVSPSSTSSAEGGIMQRGLDNWLKEEWTPLTKPAQISAAQSVQTTQSEPATPKVAEPEDTAPFTLQKYADKWKIYQENKEKINEGKAKEASHVERMGSLPVIGK